jgi:hypothetical protein
VPISLDEKENQEVAESICYQGVFLSWYQGVKYWEAVPTNNRTFLVYPKQKRQEPPVKMQLLSISYLKLATLKQIDNSEIAIWQGNMC